MSTQKLPKQIRREIAQQYEHLRSIGKETLSTPKLCTLETKK